MFIFSKRCFRVCISPERIMTNVIIYHKYKVTVFKGLPKFGIISLTDYLGHCQTSVMKSFRKKLLLKIVNYFYKKSSS